MTITVIKKRIEIVEITREGESADLLRSYVQLHNERLETMEWLKKKSGQRHLGDAKWDLEAMRRVVLALDAGFDPYTPPPTWHKGQLITYRGTIPPRAREQIEIAIPIFRPLWNREYPEGGPHGISIYDPRPDMFRPALCPIATGYVRLSDQLHHFLIAQWDLDQDLKYLTADGGAADPED